MPELPSPITLLVSEIPLLGFFLKYKGWKTRAFIMLIGGIFLFGYMGYGWYKTNELLRETETKRADFEKISNSNKTDAEKYRETQKSTKSGEAKGDNTDLTKSASVFIDYWDTSKFKDMGNDTYCPIKSGGNWSQRMTYKYETPLTSSYLDIKFQMVDQDLARPTNNQRVITGIESDKAIIFEHDIPTRNGQNVNFRTIATDSSKLITGKGGTDLSDPIKEGSIVTLNLKTQEKHGSDITSIATANYFSAITGAILKNDYVGDTTTKDPDAQSSKGKVFIASYVGNCIKILDGWQVN